ncbi:hypothetical protein BS50DRAFT_570250 [Corynespora cassiicola Philippines]|uniref:Uncharacterized protein n=1 Tax=Corynespora cassiicola Philippines TaxID=1448308 RepID=A0A2T2NZ95_CORCC|nr:hypothetical protein BS50DRAFT_570250 [Corynespora cassiicola Philippines]
MHHPWKSPLALPPRIKNTQNIPKFPLPLWDEPSALPEPDEFSEHVVCSVSFQRDSQHRCIQNVRWKEPVGLGSILAIAITQDGLKRLRPKIRHGIRRYMIYARVWRRSSCDFSVVHANGVQAEVSPKSHEGEGRFQ